ncbi:DUF397 domain-containing protein [Streptomyces sp. NEAU-W12]|nr:DUF397 domain-containing protein [Streptomyces sp. NEAU-W12]
MRSPTSAERHRRLLWRESGYGGNEGDECVETAAAPGTVRVAAPRT